MEGRDDGEEEAESHLKGCNDQKKIDAYQVLLHGVGESSNLKVKIELIPLVSGTAAQERRIGPAQRRVGLHAAIHEQ